MGLKGKATAFLLFAHRIMWSVRRLPMVNALQKIKLKKRVVCEINQNQGELGKESHC